MNSGSLTGLAGATLLIPACMWWLAGGHMPSALYPLPVLVLLPALFGLKQAAIVFPVVLFFIWNAPLIDGAAVVPKRSFLLMVFATVTNALWFGVGWRDGLDMQGARYTAVVCVVNVVWMLVLWLLFLTVRKRQPDFRMNLFLHWLMFLWFSWYAWPFFGELP